MRLSIIVPAYKVENYIEKCIRSLENQDIPKQDFEIIITNDGSPDSSKAIVEKLQLEFNNIVLINQENQGVSVARNNALAIAKGNYIMPIDPDDYVLPNAFKNILEKVEAQDLDVLYLSFEIFDAEGKSSWQTNFSEQEKKIYDGVDGYLASRGPNIKDPNRSWAILYRKSLLDFYKIQYPINVPFLEDGCFLVKVFSVAKTVGFDNSKFHQRTTSKGSATVTGVYYSDKAMKGFLKAAKEIKDFQSKYSFSKKQNGLLNLGIVNFVLLTIFPNVNFSSLNKLKKIIEEIKAAGFVNLETLGVVEPYYKYAQYFNISPYLFVLKYANEKFYKILFKNFIK